MQTRLPTGPPGHWLTGHLGPFGRDRLNFLERCARDHGDFVPFRLGPRRCVLVSHPDLIEEVLVTRNRSFHKHFGLRYFRGLIGDGLLTSEDDFWLRQRRLIQPAFHARRLEQYAVTMADLTEQMLAEWKPGQTLDLHAQFAQLTLLIATRTLFAADARADVSEVASAIRSALIDSNARFGQLLPMPDWVPTPANLRLRRSTQRLRQVIDRIIRQRQSQPEGDDLLSALLAARDETDGRAMSERQLRDEVMTLFLAGHGTTANALSWTWYLLAQHPEIEARVADEARSVLGDRVATAADVPRLTFTSHVVTESMRLYPPAYVIGRSAIEDCPLGNHRLRRGWTVFMSQWVVHRDERFFEEPLTFRPDRWADGLARRLPKYAYFPFGGGPRVCIGNTFALLELPLIVASIARRWRFVLDPTHVVTPWAAVTLRPENGIRATLQPR